MDLHTPGDKTFSFGKLYKVRDAYASMVNESYQQTQQNKVFNYIVESIKVNDVKRIKKFATKNRKLADIAMTNAINRALSSIKRAFKGMKMTDSMKKALVKKVRVAINAEIEPSIRLGKKQSKTIPSKMKPRKIMSIHESEDEIVDRMSAKKLGSEEEFDTEQDIETSDTDKSFTAKNFKLTYFDFDKNDYVRERITSDGKFTFSSPEELHDKMEDVLREYGDTVEFYVTDDYEELKNPDIGGFKNDNEYDTERIRSLSRSRHADEYEAELNKDSVYVLAYTMHKEDEDDEGEAYWIRTKVEADYGSEIDHDEFKELSTVSLDEIPSAICGKDSTESDGEYTPSFDDEEDVSDEEDDDSEELEDIDDTSNYEDEDEEDFELEELDESDKDILDAFDNGDLDDQLSLDGVPVDESKSCKKCQNGKKTFKKIRNI